MSKRIPIWDLPTRLFHWLLVLLLPCSWLSAEFDAMRIHELCGYTVLTLLGFRLVWGLIGSRHSRFADFVRGPVAVLRYWRSQGDAPEGHNPAGGWSVLAMLLLLLVQAVTGLYNADDVGFSGPLNHTVRNSLADTLGEWHEINFNLLLALIALHIGAIAFYFVRRGRNLVRPMLTGGQSSHPGLQTTPTWLAALVLAACAGLLYWLLSLIPAPQVFL